jgi:hypothetical protein
VPQRSFTLAEARAALADVRPIVERLVESRADQLALRARAAELMAVMAGNGHGTQREQAVKASQEAERAEAAIVECLHALEEIGVVVKSVDAGLVDFPSQRDGRGVFLCWQFGEPDIEYWHGLEEGFAGRKPV